MFSSIRVTPILILTHHKEMDTVGLTIYFLKPDGSILPYYHRRETADHTNRLRLPS